MLSIRSYFNKNQSKMAARKPWASTHTLAIYLIILFSLVACQGNKQAPQTTSFDSSSFQEGDFIMRRGYGLVSTFIAKNYGGTHQQSHVGIVVKREAKLSVIHSISKQLSNKEGVIEESLETFIADAQPGNLYIYSPRPGSNPQRQLIAKTAKRLAAANTPFDMEFNVQDTTQLFCTELVLYCLKKASPHDSLLNHPLKPLSKGLDLFDDSRLFSLKFVLSKKQ